MAKAKKPRSDDAAARRAALYDELDSVLGEGRVRAVVDLEPEPIERVHTGSLLFDWAMGGGFPYGRIIEIYGPPSGGKSALGLLTLAKIQAQGHLVGIVDSERQFDPEWGRKLGLTDEVLLHKPVSGEDAFRCMEVWAKHGVRGILFDSLTMAKPEEELKGDIAEVKMGAMARLWSKGLPRLAPHIEENKVCLMFINQMRANVQSRNPFDQLTTGGGWALRHVFTVKLEVLPSSRIRDSDKVDLGFYTRLKVVKNRGPMFRVVKVPFIQGQGWSQEREVLDLALLAGAIVKSGSWFALEDGTNIGQGYEAVVLKLLANPELLETLRARVERELNEGIIRPPMPGADAE